MDLKGQFASSEMFAEDTASDAVSTNPFLC